MRFGLRTLAVVTIAALGLVGAAGAIAGASPAANDPSFLGTYAIHGNVTGTSEHLRGSLTFNADGSGTDNNGDKFHWSNSGPTVTVTYHDKMVSETFVGTQSKKGISSKKTPGTFTTNIAGVNGTWWGIKKS